MSVLIVIILMMMGMSQLFAATPPSSEPIGVFDLRYTLEMHPDDRESINQAWDHCHAAATLQGIVNRQTPKLYYIYVNSLWNLEINIDEYWLDKYRRKGQWLWSGRIVRTLTEP